MRLIQNRMGLAVLAWLPVAGIITILYRFVDFPGSVPLYFSLGLWTSAVLATAVTAVLAGSFVYDKTRQNTTSLITAVASGAVIWALTAKIVMSLLATVNG